MTLKNLVVLSLSLFSLPPLPSLPPSPSFPPSLCKQQKFGIKTAGLEEKCTAMQMLVVYAKDLKEGFAEYAPSIAKIMVPHLKFFFHELVRAAAAEILPHLLECVKAKGQRKIPCWY